MRGGVGLVRWANDDGGFKRLDLADEEQARWQGDEESWAYASEAAEVVMSSARRGL